MTRMSVQESLVWFAKRCWYRHRKTVKPTTVITIEQTSLTDVIMHRFPGWMPMNMHLCLEKVLEMILKLDPERKIYFTKLAAPYHIAHGLVCDYTMRDIIKFIRHAGDKKFYANQYWND